MEEQSLVKNFDDFSQKLNFKEILIPVVVILAIILSGGVTGYLLANWKSGKTVAPTKKKLIGGAELIQGLKEVGIKDVKTFRDTTEGRIEINDSPDVPEGSHKLIRPGGPSQTAYLTSSVINLNQFLGKCVQVWGETFAAQKAGWLMDVGRVKILDRCPEGI